MISVKRIDNLISALEKLRRQVVTSSFPEGECCARCGGEIRSSRYGYICQQSRGPCGELWVLVRDYKPFFSRTRMDFSFGIVGANPINETHVYITLCGGTKIESVRRGFIKD